MPRVPQDDDGAYEVGQSLSALAEHMAHRGDAARHSSSGDGAGPDCGVRGRDSDSDDGNENGYDCLRDVGGIAEPLQAAYAVVSARIDRTQLSAVMSHEPGSAEGEAGVRAAMSAGGLLVVGPDGSGKTTFVRTLARSLQSNLHCLTHVVRLPSSAPVCWCPRRVGPCVSCPVAGVV